MPQHQPDLYNYVIPILILLPFLYFRLRRMLKPQALKLQWLWVRPAVLIVIALFVLLMPVPNAPALTAMTLFCLALAAAVGAAVGWQLGRTTKLHIHPENGTLMQSGSMAGMIVLVGLVVLRLGLRTGLRFEANSWHLNVLLIADVSILFSAFLFATRGLEIFLRARKVMAQTVPAAFD